MVVSWCIQVVILNENKSSNKSNVIKFIKHVTTSNDAYE